MTQECRRMTEARQMLRVSTNKGQSSDKLAAESNELHTLTAVGIISIAVDFKQSSHRDRWGNTFRYRAKVYGTNPTNLGRWAYDVLLLHGS